MRISDWSSDVCSSDLIVASRALNIYTRGSGNGARNEITARNQGYRNRFPIAFLFGLGVTSFVPIENLVKLVNRARYIPPSDASGIGEFLCLPRRSEKRRVGKECVSTCRPPWSPD